MCTEVKMSVVVIVNVNLKCEMLCTMSNSKENIFCQKSILHGYTESLL